MLQAPITFTTAKLDISLLLSQSPSPPTRSPPLPGRGPSEPASAIASSSVQFPPHSHSTSMSSTLSTSFPQVTLVSPLAPRPSLPPISAVNIAAAAPAGYAGFRVSPTRSSVSASVQGQVHAHNLAIPPSAPTLQPHASAKRPPPPGPHPAASPAKKQSKWAAEENSVLIELRGVGMKWEDISRRIPGRSAISCRLHYQNYLERRLDWDEEKKDRLARLYERLKPEIWNPLATELGIPWRAAEAMHWQLGEVDMAQRAGVTPFTTTSTSPSGPLPPTTGPPSLPSCSSTPQAPQPVLYHHHHSPPLYSRTYDPDGRRTPFAPERLTRGPGARRTARRGSADTPELLGAGPRLAELGTGWEGRGREVVLPGLADLERGVEPFEYRGQGSGVVVGVGIGVGAGAEAGHDGRRGRSRGHSQIGSSGSSGSQRRAEDDVDMQGDRQAKETSAERSGVDAPRTESQDSRAGSRAASQTDNRKTESS